MARYTAGCSSVGGYGYAGNFTLYVDLTEKWIDSSSNSSYVDYNVFAQSNGSGSISSRHFKYFNIGSEEKVNVTENVNASSPNAYIQIASGTIGPIYHDSSGNQIIYFNAQIKASSYGISAEIDDSFRLSTIPRYTTVTNTERGKTVNSISVNWTTTDARDYTQYSLNGGAWQDAYDTVASDNKSGYYTISGLNPNTQYSVKTRCKRTDSQLWSEAGAINIKTYDIAKITSISNFVLGDNLTVDYSNPSGSQIALGIFKEDRTTKLLDYRNCSGNRYIYNFTNAELDNLYKYLNNKNDTTVCIKIRTTSNNIQYYNENFSILILTGNQKTGHIKLNGNWHRTKKWIKIDGTWRRCVRWINVNGVWKRCI